MTGNMVKPFIDPVTHDKIRFVPNDLDRLETGKSSTLKVRSVGFEAFSK